MNAYEMQMTNARWNVLEMLGRRNDKEVNVHRVTSNHLQRHHQRHSMKNNDLYNESICTYTIYDFFAQINNEQATHNIYLYQQIHSFVTISFHIPFFNSHIAYTQYAHLINSLFACSTLIIVICLCT